MVLISSNGNDWCKHCVMRFDCYWRERLFIRDNIRYMYLFWIPKISGRAFYFPLFYPKSALTSHQRRHKTFEEILPSNSVESISYSLSRSIWDSGQEPHFGSCIFYLSKEFQEPYCIKDRLLTSPSFIFILFFCHEKLSQNILSKCANTGSLFIVYVDKSKHFNLWSTWDFHSSVRHVIFIFCQCMPHGVWIPLKWCHLA